MNERTARGDVPLRRFFPFQHPPRKLPAAKPERNGKSHGKGGDDQNKRRIDDLSGDPQLVEYHKDANGVDRAFADQRESRMLPLLQSLLDDRVDNIARQQDHDRSQNIRKIGDNRAADVCDDLQMQYAEALNYKKDHHDGTDRPANGLGQGELRRLAVKQAGQLVVKARRRDEALHDAAYELRDCAADHDDHERRQEFKYAMKQKAISIIAADCFFGV